MFKHVSVLPSKSLILSILLSLVLVTGCSNIESIKDKSFSSSRIKAAAILGAYEKYSVEELFSWSSVTPSNAEKLQIRAYLKKHHADSAAGLYSSAYLADENNQTTLEHKFASELLSAYPYNPVTWFYHSFNKNNETKIRMTKMGLNRAPEFENYKFFIRLADIYIEEKLNRNELLTTISEYEESLGKDIYIFDYVRGLVEQKINNDVVKAHRYYESALTKTGGVKEWPLWRKYFDNQYGENGLLKNYSDKVYNDDVASALVKIKNSDINSLYKGILFHQILSELIADRAQDNGQNRIAERYYKQANYYYFTSETTSQVRSVIVAQNKKADIEDYLTDVIKKLPTNPDALGQYAEDLAFTYQYDKAEYYYKLSLKNSQNTADKNHYTKHYIRRVLYPTFRASESIKLLENLENNTEKKSVHLNKALAEAHVFSGNYKKAQGYINKVNTQSRDNKNTWPNNSDLIVSDYVTRNNEINTAVRADQASTKIEVLTTSSATVDWMTVNPNSKSFLGNNGSTTYWQWDADKLSVTNKFENSIIDTGYSKYMTRPVFSPNGRYFAYVTEFKNDVGSVMLIYDIKEQHFVRQLPMIKKTSGLAWSPDGSEIAIWNYGRLIKYNFSDAKVVQQQEVKGQDGADSMVWTTDGKYIALLDRHANGFIRVYDADSFEELPKLGQVSWPHAIGVSTDGRYIFSADNRYMLHKWDTHNNFSHSSIKIPVLGRIISSHPSKPQIVVNDWKGRNKLIVVNYNEMKIVAEKATGSAELRAYYIMDGKKIIASNVKDDVIEVYDSQTLEKLQDYKGESAVTKGIYANSENNQLVSWDQEGLHVWSIVNGRKQHFWQGNFQSVLANPDAPNKLYGLIKDPNLKVTNIWSFNLIDMSKELIGEPNFIIDKWGFEGKNIILSGQHYMPMDKGTYDGVVLLVDTEENTYQSVIVDMVTDELNYPRLSKTHFMHVAVSPNRRYLALSTAWIDGWRRSETKSKVTRIYDIENEKLLNTINKVGVLAFKDDNHLAIGDDGKLNKNSSLYSIKTAKISGKFGVEHTAPNISAHISLPSNVNFPKHNLSVTISKDNVINFYGSKHNKLLLTIQAKRNDEWLAYLPTGEFSSSAKGLNKTQWRVNGKNLSTEEIEKFRKKGLILDRLSANINL